MNEARPALYALAERLGIEAGYRAVDGQPVQVPEATLEALAGAMGYAAHDEAAASRALRDFEELETAGFPDPLAAEDCLPASAVLGERSAFGIVANLYSMRSRARAAGPGDPGHGTFAELAALVRQAARRGAAFVGINPLHALAAADGQASPYTPESRLYRSPLYLDLSDVPELAESPPARRRLEAAQATPGAARIEPRARDALVSAVCRELHARLRSGRGAAADARRADFDAWRRGEGAALERYATFCALAEEQSRAGLPRDWRRWPEALRDPASPAVRAFAREAAEAVERHAFVQFEVDRQLGAVAALARDEGMAIGLYTDLALGSDPGGADTWAARDRFVSGARLGAPPDAFAPEGQDWGLPPLHPHVLRQHGYDFFERVLEANLRHAGALRLDHALGLRRLFWIPEGAAPSAGAYVRQPEADLLAVLGRVSRRRGALVIGEDLGNVPAGFSEAIQARGLLGSRVLLFERDARGFHPAAAYPARCLATLNTHDLPPFAAWVSGADLALRRRVGQIPSEAALEQASVERAAERAALVDRIRAEGIPLASDAPQPAALAVAATAFLCASPAVLVGVALDDLGFEMEPINLPGVGPATHASWLRRMRLPVEAIFEDEGALRMLDAVPAARRAPARVA